jgi:hypothetical protein
MRRALERCVRRVSAGSNHGHGPNRAEEDWMEIETPPREDDPHIPEPPNEPEAPVAPPPDPDPDRTKESPAPDPEGP